MMNASSMLTAVLVLGCAAILGCGRDEGEDRHPRQESAARNHPLEREREVVDLVPDPGDAPTRRGLEPAPERGAAAKRPVGQSLSEDREVFIADTRARLAEIDRELDEVRRQAQARRQQVSEHLLEERQIVARQFDALLRAPEDDWKDLRNQLAQRIDELAFTVDQAQGTNPGVPLVPSPPSPSVP